MQAGFLSEDLVMRIGQGNWLWQWELLLVPAAKICREILGYS